MAPGRRRIYSNAGIERAAELVAARAEMTFAEYLTHAVVAPLGLSGSLDDSPAWGYRGTLDDLLRLGGELLAPTVVAPETLAEATSVQFPGSSACSRAGVGWSRTTGVSRSSCGTGSRRTGLAPVPRRARSGTSARTARSSGSTRRPASRAACSPSAAFGDWAKEAWPALSDAVHVEAASSGK